jgi:hypothetical protein
MPSHIKTMLLELFGNPPIADALFPHLTLADVFGLRRVCRALQYILQRELDHRLKIEPQLMTFVNDCELFRLELGRDNALVVGAFVLNLLDMCRRKIPHLDVLVEEGPPVDSFVQYLCSEEGYGVSSTDAVRKEKLRTRTFADL